MAGHLQPGCRHIHHPTNCSMLPPRVCVGWSAVLVLLFGLLLPNLHREQPVSAAVESSRLLGPHCPHTCDQCAQGGGGGGGGGGGAACGGGGGGGAVGHVVVV